MRAEALEAPAVAEALLQADGQTLEGLANSLREAPPRALLTVARGSSDHAAHYAAYLVMARLGQLVTSLPMSLVTLYASRLACDGLVSLAFSQSGQSPDLLAPTAYFRAHGARTVAFVNDAGSPLAQASQWVLPLHAGPERSVAATKSYIAQLVAGARLVAHWETDSPLKPALRSLPEALQRACACDWGAAVEALSSVDRLIVVIRGTGQAVAMEAPWPWPSQATRCWCWPALAPLKPTRCNWPPSGAREGYACCWRLRRTHPGWTCPWLAHRTTTWPPSSPCSRTT